MIISKLHGDKNLNSSPNKIIIVIPNNKKIHWKFGKLHNKTIKMYFSLRLMIFHFQRLHRISTEQKLQPTKEPFIVMKHEDTKDNQR